MHTKWLSKVLFIWTTVYGGLAAVADTESIVRQNEKAAVVIQGTKQDSGASVQSSGCCIHESGLVLTTAHQVTGVGSLRAKFIDGTSSTLTVLAVDEAHELALLKLAAPPSHIARVGDASTLRSGSPLVSIAAPENLDFSTVTGIVSNTNRTYQGFPVLQTNIPASPGSSGGPVFDRNGLLIGVLIGKLRDQEWVTIINPVNNAYPLIRKYGVAISADHTDTIGEITPEKNADGVQRQAIDAYNQGVKAASSAEKIDHYTAAVTLFPAFYEAWFNRASAYAANGDYEHALSDYGHAETLKTSAVEVYRNKGRILLKQRNFPEAIACFERAVLLAPNDAPVHNDLGEARRQAEDFAKAASSFEKALTLNPAYGEARYNLGLTYAALGRHDEAVEQFQTYLNNTPDAPDTAQVKEWITRLQSQEKKR